MFATAWIFESITAGKGIIARIGGDAFAILLIRPEEGGPIDGEE